MGEVYVQIILEENQNQHGKKAEKTVWKSVLEKYLILTSSSRFFKL
jgi:hypothetical protein